MFDIITIGSATRDLYLLTKDFKTSPAPKEETKPLVCFILGSKVEVDNISFDIGGGGTNTAVGFSRLGFKTAFLGRIGAYDQRGKEIKEILEKERVNTSLIIKDKKHATALSVLLLNPQGERTILVYRGASAHFHISEIPWLKLKSRWFYITTLGGNLSLIKKILSYAHKNNIKIAFNPGVQELKHGAFKLRLILRQVDILFLNREEAAQLANIPSAYEDKIFKTLCFWLPGIVVITDGSRGAMVCDNQKKYLIKAHKIKVIDATGAGDSFGTGFVGAFIKSKGNIPYALQMGIENATSVIKHLGPKKGLLKKFPQKNLLPVKIYQFPN